jgi:peptidoglycan/xylan/chitin deacetylase (PgdA/CDA1 family)
MINILTILVYHHVGESFAQQLAFLGKFARLVGIEEGLRNLKETRFNKPMVAITFDDAYEEVFTYAFPHLQSRGLPASLYVPTHYVGKKDPFWWDYVDLMFKNTRKAQVVWKGRTYYLTDSIGRDQAAASVRAELRMSPAAERDGAVCELQEALAIRELAIPETYNIMDWDQIQAMSDAGIEIGAHGTKHEALSVLPPEQLSRELLNSKEILESRLKRRITGLAYPFGGKEYVNNQVCLQANACGYRYGLTTLPGVNRRSTDPFRLARYFIGAQTGGGWRLWMLARGNWHYMQPFRRLWHRIKPRTRGSV